MLQPFRGTNISKESSLADWHVPPGDHACPGVPVIGVDLVPLRILQGEDVLVEQEPGVTAGLAQQCLLLLHVDLCSVHAQVDLHGLIGLHSSMRLLRLGFVDGLPRFAVWWSRPPSRPPLAWGPFLALPGAGSIDPRPGSDEEPAPGAGSQIRVPQERHSRIPDPQLRVPVATAAGAYSSAWHRRPPHEEAFA